MTERDALRKWLDTLDGVPMSIDSVDLARLMCDLPSRSRLPEQSVIVQARWDLLVAAKNPPKGFGSMEIREYGRKTTVKFWRTDHHEQH